MHNRGCSHTHHAIAAAATDSEGAIRSSNMRPLPRFIWHASACLALGAGTSVAVAWTLAIVRPSPSGEPVRLVDRDGQDNRSSLSMLRLRGVGAERRIWRHILGLRLSTPMTRPDPRSRIARLEDMRQWGRTPPDLSDTGASYIGEQWADDARGWPALCVWCSIEHGNPPAFGFRAIGGILLRTSSGGLLDPHLTCLPYRPIWSGMAINTAVHTPSWIALFLGARAVRALRRRWRGLCPACGYDLCHGHADGCPECGWNRVGKPAGTAAPTRG